MTASITLSAGAWTAQIGPDLGGALLSLSRDGEPILRPTPASAVETGDVLLTAGYPMMPYANRIDQGRFRFAGADYHLTTGALGAPHSLHGLAWRRAWAIDSRSAGACTLSLGHHPAGADDPDWPFAFGASQRFILTTRGLTIRLSMTNLEATPAPAGVGLHTFFRRRPGETLRFGAKAAWRNGPDMLPLATETGDAWNFAAGRALDQHVLDNDFSGWGGLARMSAPGAATIRMRASRAFGALRLYAPAGGDFYAVEPVSHLANAINRPELEEGAMTILSPGASMLGEIDIDVLEAGL